MALHNNLPLAKQGARRLVGLLSAALAALPPLYLVAIVLSSTVDVPFADQWGLVPLLARSYDGTLAPSDLWNQHNEHRLVFPRLLMLALARLSGWNTHVEMLANIVLAGGLLGLLAAQVRATAQQAGVALGWLLPPLSLMVFSLNQAENWWSGWNMQIFLAVAAASAALLLLSHQPRSWPALALAVASALVATFSYSTGLLVWGVGLAAGAALARPWSARAAGQIALWAGAGALAAAAFFHNYWWSPQTTPLSEVVRAPGRYLTYTLTYLGAAPTRGAVEYLFGLVTGDMRAICNLGDSDLCGYVNVAALAGGALGLLAFALVAWRLARAFSLPLVLPYLALGGYALATGAMTSLGRAGYGNSQALAQRYATTASLFWLALVVLLALSVQTNVWPRLARGAAGGLLAAIVGLTLLGTLQGVDHFGWQREFLAPARDELVHLQDDDLLRRLYFDPAFVREGARTLQQHRLSVFRP